MQARVVMAARAGHYRCIQGGLRSEGGILGLITKSPCAFHHSTAWFLGGKCGCLTHLTREVAHETFCSTLFAFARALPHSSGMTLHPEPKNPDLARFMDKDLGNYRRPAPQSRRLTLAF